MFKEIISRDNGCPWGTTGLTSALWLEIPVHNVLIADLIATQPSIHLHAISEPYISLERFDPYPHIVLWKGEMYLEDGHHRVVRARLDGKITIDARILLIES